MSAAGRKDRAADSSAVGGTKSRIKSICAKPPCFATADVAQFEGRAGQSRRQCAGLRWRTKGTPRHQASARSRHRRCVGHGRRDGPFVAVAVTIAGRGVAADRLDVLSNPSHHQGGGKVTVSASARRSVFARQSGGDIMVRQSPAVRHSRILPTGEEPATRRFAARQTPKRGQRADMSAGGGDTEDGVGRFSTDVQYLGTPQRNGRCQGGAATCEDEMGSTGIQMSSAGRTRRTTTISGSRYPRSAGCVTSGYSSAWAAMPIAVLR